MSVMIFLLCRIVPGILYCIIQERYSSNHIKPALLGDTLRISPATCMSFYLRLPPLLNLESLLIPALVTFGLGRLVDLGKIPFLALAMAHKFSVQYKYNDSVFNNQYGKQPPESFQSEFLPPIEFLFYLYRSD